MWREKSVERLKENTQYDLLYGRACEIEFLGPDFHSVSPHPNALPNRDVVTPEFNLRFHQIQRACSVLLFGHGLTENYPRFTDSVNDPFRVHLL